MMNGADHEGRVKAGAHDPGAKALAILNRSNEGLNHLSVDEVADPDPSVFCPSQKHL